MPLGRILIYTKKLPEMEAFYCRHFGFTAHHLPNDRIVELRPSDGGAVILLHPAAKSQRDGQALVKLVFDIPDVPAFCARAKANGLDFGPIHTGDGYAFANAKDPGKNSVSVSSRAFA